MLPLILLCISHLTSPADAALLTHAAQQAGMDVRQNPPDARDRGMVADCTYIATPGILHNADAVFATGIILFRAPLTSERADKLIAVTKGLRP